ncbi:MAG TPA: peptidoglycan DD-metalloendopeptidase family protein [Ignavibacteria bacterium]|nr:peptidoglycan DD-metalloendopeptidase family protein [Ignavibacteria bacterium]
MAVIKKYWIFLFLFSFCFSTAKADYDFVADKLKQIENYRQDLYEIDNMLKENDLSIINYQQELAQINEELSYIIKFINYVDKSQIADYDLIEDEIEIRNLKEKADNLKENLKNKIVNLYKSGKIYEDQLLLSSKSLNDFKIRLTYLNKFAESRKKEFDNIKETYYLLEDKKRLSFLKSREKLRYILDKKEDQRTLSEKKIIVENNLHDLLNVNDNLVRQRDKILNDIAVLEKIINERFVNPVFKINQVPNYPDSNFSLLKGKLILPVQSVNIIENFGNTFNRLTKTNSFNNGMDVSIAEGSDVKAIANGVVTEVTFLPVLGNIVIVEHENGYKSIYAIVKDISVNVDDEIVAGQIIGKTSQNFRGQSFHFELWKDDVPLDPKQWLRLN